MKELQFTVYGVPQPKGSMRCWGKAFEDLLTGRWRVVQTVRAANKKLEPWEAEIRRTLRDLPRVEFFPGPVTVHLDFHLPTLPTRPPDLDKLVRGALDALTGVVWTDDAQVTRLVAVKQRCVEGRPRAVYRITDQPDTMCPKEP